MLTNFSNLGFTFGMKPALQKKGLRLFQYLKSLDLLNQDETCPTEKGIATISIFKKS